MDYYSILGIEKNAGAKHIKKAYHKKAIKEHPDKGGDAEKFKKIARAYEVLSDPDKRNLYDKFGEDGLKETTFSQPTDIFSMFFGMQKKKEETSFFHTLNVKLSNLYKGIKIKLNITRRRVCYPKDVDKSNALIFCKHCDGHGTKNETVQIAFGICRQTQIMCEKCQGKGKYMRKGVTVNKQTKLIIIDIKAGAKHNDHIVFKGESDEEPGKAPKDLVIIINEIPNKNFTRNDEHLNTTFEISLWQALCGEVIKIPFIDNSIIKVQSDEIINSDKLFCIPGKGMKSYANLYITFKIKFPDKLLFDEKNYIKNKFGNQESEDLENIVKIHSKLKTHSHNTHRNTPQGMPQFGNMPQGMPQGMPFGNMPQGMPFGNMQPECTQQ